MKTFKVPEGTLRSSNGFETLHPHADDGAAADLRRKIREKLLHGKTVTVSANGNIEEKKGAGDHDSIQIPAGKLASPLGFYWYENSPDVLESEKSAMRHFFPAFVMKRLDDGRLYWLGDFCSNITGTKWVLQVIYDHDHPSNKNYGGSVKVYPVIPVLEELRDASKKSIPHTLIDGDGNLYICTARNQDIKIGYKNFTAASALAFAAKWIAAFELWSVGELSDEEFGGHNI